MLWVLLMANVMLGQYLFGIGCYVFFACLLGGAIGVGSKNQMAATLVALPIMVMVYVLLLVLLVFHHGIAKIAEFTYSGQVRILEFW